MINFSSKNTAMKILLYILSLPSALITALIAFACIFRQGVIFIIFTPIGFPLFAGTVVLVFYYFIRSKNILTMSIKVGIPLLFVFLWQTYEYYTGEYRPYRGEKFNKEKWQENAMITEQHTNMRCKMYSDIIANHIKNGTKLQTIKEVFGVPANLVTYCLDKKIKCIGYKLGTCGMTTPVYLHICFNDNQEVIHFGKSYYFSIDICGDTFATCNVDQKKCYCDRPGKNAYGLKTQVSEECPQMDMW